MAKILNYNHIKIRTVLILVLLTTQISAQQETIGSRIWTDFKSSINLGGDVASAPFNFTSSDWIKLGITGLTTAALFAADRDIKNLAQNNQSNFGNSLFKIDDYYGTIYTAAFTAGIYGAGLLGGNDEIRNLGLQTMEAFAYSGLITTVLKVGFGRRRPFAGESNSVFHPFGFEGNKFQSLPSGHTTVTFAVSTVMANYSDNVLWKIFWYGAAGTVGLARIYNDQHWASDVFLGAAIGYFVGQFVANRHEKSSSQKNGAISASVSPQFVGITIPL